MKKSKHNPKKVPAFFEWRRCRDSNPVPHKFPLGAISYVDTSTPPKGEEGNIEPIREYRAPPQIVGKGWQIIPPDAFAPTTYSLPPQESRTLALPYGQQYCLHDAHYTLALAAHGEETCKPPERDLSRLG